jgi:hypothetical protein
MSRLERARPPGILLSWRLCRKMRAEGMTTLPLGRMHLDVHGGVHQRPRAGG